MRISLRGGTDAGTMALFDRAALPRDYHTPQFANPNWKSLQMEEQICVLETSSDGEYVVDLVEELSSIEIEFGISRSRSRLQVPSGTLHFCGIEFVFWPQGLSKYPHMGQSLELACGVYEVEVFEIEYPDDWEEDQLRQRLGNGRYEQLGRSINRGCGFGCLICVAAITFFMAIAEFWLGTATFVAFLLLIIGAFWWRHERQFKIFREQVEVEQEFIANEFPGWVVRLTSLASD